MCGQVVERTHTLLSFIPLTPSLPLPVQLTYILQYLGYITSQSCWSPQAAQSQQHTPPRLVFYTHKHTPQYDLLLTALYMRKLPSWVTPPLLSYFGICEGKLKLGQHKSFRVLYATHKLLPDPLLLHLQVPFVTILEISLHSNSIYVMN